jgi:hypothetical protein
MAMMKMAEQFLKVSTFYGLKTSILERPYARKWLRSINKK